MPSQLVNRRRGRTGPPRPAFFIFLTAISVLPVNVYLPALPGIAEEFDSGYALANLSVAGFAIVGALTEMVAGALSDRFGRRPVVLVSVSVFIVASIGCALAPSIGFFLVCRGFQASIAACFSVAMVVIKETSTGGEAVRKIGFAGMGWALAPMSAPTLGGIVDELAGWRAIFAVLAVLGATVLVVSMRRMTETSVHLGPSRGGVLGSFRRVLASPRFWAYTLCMACSMGTLYVFLGGAPLVMRERLGGSSAALGLYMAMVPAGFILGSYLTGRWGPQIFRSRVLVCARILTWGALLAGVTITTWYDIGAPTFFAFCVFIGIGNGLTTPAVSMGVMSGSADLAGTAMGLSAALSIGGAALISSVAGLFLGAAGSVHVLLILLLAPASLALLAAFAAALADRQPRAEESAVGA